MTKTSPPQIVTFGCRLNSYESEVIRDILKDNKCSDEVIVFNTCGVTAEAERQARQAIRKARREKPQARIIVTGCAVQMNSEPYVAMREIDLILGNQEKLDPQSYASLLNPSSERLLVNDIMSVQETALHMISGLEDRVRAFLQVQNGCDHRCTFCRIPFGRGNNRSVPIGQIVQTIQHLMENNVQEIVLTGVDITDYGKDLPGKPSLGEMITRVLNLVPSLKRLRLSSLDPVEVDETLLKLIVSDERILPHIHISLQAGNDLILKRMKRRHLRQDVIDFCHTVRAARPDVVFGADIIAGFPTESEDMFLDSLRIVDECDLTFLHIFPFSAHKETPASRMPQVSSHAIKERAKRLRDKGTQKLSAYLDTQIGKSIEVLLEKDNSGHTRTFAQAQVEGPSFSRGQIVTGTGQSHNGKTIKVHVS
ncbi:MAG: tRNA (N(6)-L-threonylcarbamoyladenosine(37)-C(2))-methylthiotransferase MtaB [Alphaproteobacteria bacterium]|nr:tRNA (N(6)-L-threonylcarbamoyladenosine(37)-C(2))-methylthiotransferase MtaB [Alphaproteobacteria bacterium]OJV46345.1 MAG: tRNA (N(6)-L-threonylcarbamoyladenosine(37)-C(2))-methylthiotransferase MtaB [Alphaproteobacteria bacterium 43-37]